MTEQVDDGLEELFSSLTPAEQARLPVGEHEWSAVLFARQMKVAKGECSPCMCELIRELVGRPPSQGKGWVN